MKCIEKRIDGEVKYSGLIVKVRLDRAELENGKIVSVNWYQPRLRNGRMMLEVQIPYSVRPGPARIRLQPVDAISSPVKSIGCPSPSSFRARPPPREAIFVRSTTS